MRVHRNAKTTIKMRQLIATRAQEGWTYARIGAALGLSVRTVAKWSRAPATRNSRMARRARSDNRDA